MLNKGESPFTRRRQGRGESEYMACWDVLVLKLELALFYLDIEQHSSLLVPTSQCREPCSISIWKKRYF